MNRVVKAFFAATLAAGLVFGSITAGDVMAKDRGKSGLPPGPGNPLASLQSQINQLQTQINELKPQANLLWINHLGLMADPVDTLTVSQATAPLAGASGLLIKSAGAVANKGLEVGLQVPPGYTITKVNICYQVSNPASFINRISLSQLTAPGTAASVLTDNSAKTSTVATCVDSSAAVTDVDPISGPVRLNVGVTFINNIDQIVIRAIGLHLEPL